MKSYIAGKETNIARIIMTVMSSASNFPKLAKNRIYPEDIAAMTYYGDKLFSKL
jgi:hypothetical protein